MARWALAMSLVLAVIAIRDPDPLRLWRQPLSLCWTLVATSALWAVLSRVHARMLRLRRRWVVRAVVLVSVAFFASTLGVFVVGLLSADIAGGASSVAWGAVNVADGASAAIRAGATGIPLAGLWFLAFAHPTAEADATRARTKAARLAVEVRAKQREACFAPHFVGNTLAAIAQTFDEDVERGNALLEHLSELLAELEGGTSETVRLEEELEWLRHYAALLEARYGDRLEFRWHMDDEAFDVAVPRLLLQPLVENAVLHGALRRTTNGIVEIRATLDDDGSMRLDVIDNGPGPSGPPGHGLEMTAERLAEHGDGRVTLLRDGDHTRASVRFDAAMAGAC